MLFLIEKVMRRVFNYFFNKYEKRRMKNYNLFEWLGESKSIELYGNLASIKEFDRTNFIDSFNRVKGEIKKEFNNEGKLEALRILLEIKVESPRLTMLPTVTITILIAIITSSIISFVNGIISFAVTGVIYEVIFMIVMFVLLMAINFFSEEIDKHKLLLKLVIECLNEYSRNDNVDNLKK